MLALENNSGGVFSTWNSKNNLAVEILLPHLNLNYVNPKLS